MVYCKDKKSAKLVYSFNNQKAKEKEFYNTPINVVKSENVDITKQVSGGRNAPHGQGAFPFTIAYPEAPTTATIWLISGVWDDYGTLGNFTAPSGQGVFTYKGSPIQIGTGNTVNGTVGSVVPVLCYANITVEFRWKGCQIEVFDFKGKKVFEDTGKCPLDFKVYCSDECPPHHIKCKKAGYPGFCCIPCDEIAQEVNSLANKLQP